MEQMALDIKSILDTMVKKSDLTEIKGLITKVDDKVEGYRLKSGNDVGKLNAKLIASEKKKTVELENMVKRLQSDLKAKCV